jgi:hypothetical protein
MRLVNHVQLGSSDQLQPESGNNPDHIAVDATVVQLNDEEYGCTPLAKYIAF